MPKTTMEGHATMNYLIDPMTYKLFYLITLMNCCIGRQGDTLDFMQDCRWLSIWGLVFLYRVLALQMSTLAPVG